MILVTAQLRCDGCGGWSERATEERPQNASRAVDRAVREAAARGWTWPLVVEGTKSCRDLNLCPACAKGETK